MVCSIPRRRVLHRRLSALPSAHRDMDGSLSVAIIRKFECSSAEVTVLMRSLRRQPQSDVLHHPLGLPSKSPVQTLIEPQPGQTSGARANISSASRHDLFQVFGHPLLPEHQTQQRRLRPLASTNQAGAHGDMSRHPPNSTAFPLASRLILHRRIILRLLAVCRILFDLFSRHLLSALLLHCHQH